MIAQLPLGKTLGQEWSGSITLHTHLWAEQLSTTETFQIQRSDRSILDSLKYFRGISFLRDQNLSGFILLCNSNEWWEREDDPTKIWFNTHLTQSPATQGQNSSTSKIRYVHANKSNFFCQATAVPCSFHVPFTFLFILNSEIVLQSTSIVHTSFHKKPPLPMALYVAIPSLLSSCTANLSKK